MAFLLPAPALVSSGLDPEDDGPHRGVSQVELLAALRRLPGHYKWRLEGDGFRGDTRLGGFPPVTEGPARLVFAATSKESESSVLVLWLSEALEADRETRDRLAVASPAAFSEGWGATFRTVRAHLGLIGTRPVMKLHGTLTIASGERAALIAWAPCAGGHWVVTALSSTKSAEHLDLLTDSVIAQLPQETPGRAGEPRVPLVLGLGLSMVLAVVLTGSLVLRRRRARTFDQLSARTSGSVP